MKKLVIFIIFLISIINTYSYNLTPMWNQTFNYGAGNDYILGIDIDSSNNLYAFGKATNGANNDYLLVKWDSDGNYIWNRSFDSTKTDSGYDVVIDNLDNIFVTGYVNHSPADLSIIKYDTSGDIIWHSVFDYGGVLDIGRQLDFDSAGNIYSGGYSAVSGNRDFVLVKFNSSGDYIWNRTYNGLGNSSDTITGLEIDSADNIVIAGETYNGSQNNIKTIKYDSSGNHIWNRTIGLPTAIDGPRVRIDSLNNIYVSGINWGAVTSILVKYDSSGNQLWNQSFNTFRTHAMTIDSSNNIILGSSNGSNSFLAIFDSTGTQLNNYSYPSIDTFEDYHFDLLGNLYAGGYSNNGNFDYHVIKFNTTANFVISPLNLQISNFPSMSITLPFILLLGYFLLF